MPALAAGTSAAVLTWTPRTPTGAGRAAPARTVASRERAAVAERCPGDAGERGLERDQMRAVLVRQAGISQTDLDAIEHLEAAEPLTSGTAS